MNFRDFFIEAFIANGCHYNDSYEFGLKIFGRPVSFTAKRIFVQLVICLVFFCPILVEATPPSVPYRVGGTVTYKGVLLTQSSGAVFTFTVTREDGTPFNPEAKDTNGLNSSNYYVIDIPIYDEETVPGGANPGDVVVVHAYENGYEVDLKSPLQGKFIVKESGSITQINLNTQPVYTYIYVEPNKNCGGNFPCYRTIQDAIDNNAINGAFLRVARGTYNENPTLDKLIKVTIEGGWDTDFKNEKSGTTIIRPPTVKPGASMIFLELVIRP